ncbi:WD40 repeat [Arabidopsis suecica]|uniref:WD40 repeat n=1 Tax=Arabidopsis suecica TaxID=45249 RepID=A0A8T2CQG6_ARASU|nr:WD40 repeat [Arabidopsis suecica]
MMSVGRSEVVDDVFFDSSDVLSIGEQVKEEEEAEFQVWSGEPVSVEERRVRFLKKMGLLEERFESMCLERMISDYSDEVTTSSSSDSSLCDSELQCCVREENYGSTTSMSDEELEGEDDDDSEEISSNASTSPLRSFSKKSAKKWLFNCFVGVKDKDFKYKSSEARMSRVKVKTNKKSHVELSAAYMVQKINGHKGKIWVLKFSPDGKYLATGGEDGVVKIWRITLSDSLLASFMRQQEPISQQEALVLFPQKAFHIEETPFQELYGHTGDVLDLAWSDSNLLLSASKDKTVRLWRIGSDQCLHVFHHNNYVTCVEFNPVNKNNFLSGSIDGKARIWGLSEERVVAWTDVRDSISAICYQPNGNGFVVGCITGNCRFYQISGNDVIMDEQILIRGRNRITTVEFCPGSSEKLMVSSDDSKVRIFDKTQIFHKFKAPSKYGKQSSASFVSFTGKHILSVRRGLGVYLWNNDGFPSRKGAKSSRSFEYFHSPGVSAAAAWTPPGAKVPKTAGDDEESRRVLRQIQSSGKLSRSCRVTATWPVEKLLMSSSDVGIYDNTLPFGEFDFAEAWRLVIVTASLDGMIRTFHNYGLPRRL